MEGLALRSKSNRFSVVVVGGASFRKQLLFQLPRRRTLAQRLSESDITSTKEPWVPMRFHFMPVFVSSFACLLHLHRWLGDVSHPFSLSTSPFAPLTRVLSVLSQPLGTDTRTGISYFIVQNVSFDSGSQSSFDRGTMGLERKNAEEDFSISWVVGNLWDFQTDRRGRRLW